MVNITRIDLNLFVVLDAIYTEGGITRASERLSLTQPAISHALARLREMLNDPLFVREGHRMVPTALTHELIGPVRRALKEIESSLNQLNHFDPASCSKTFTVGVRHIVESATIPALTARIRAVAPHVGIAAMHHDRNALHSALASGELDVAIDALLPRAPGVSFRLLGGSRFIVAARAGHPRVRDALSLDEYLQLEHVLATSRKSGPGMEDMALQRLGLERKLVARCQHYWTACQMVAMTDLVLTMPERYAATANAALNNQLLPFPLDVAGPDVYLYWHENAENDPTNRWLREQVVACFAEPGAPKGKA
ncbi:LysR family transcriptional regulator [Aquabacterium sp. A7-Y]|uniref:LysR family transcriptional regulator n=1 Tax=Aquabacterium sp. A7-Y TaxID=1349605 RepID=UPI00223D6081|nr:LysR family transcriptional regulator [Aquabacterium sp. A7-Y]MCW7541388.1 LysR family transcriptional regulator [Aquabacterium sp. A7-Y]